MVAPPDGILPPEAYSEPIVVYLTPWCGYCRTALALLRNRAVPHATVDVMGNTDARRWLLEVTGRRTVPQIFVHGRSIGGYTELSALERTGELERLVSRPAG